MLHLFRFFPHFLFFRIPLSSFGAAALCFVLVELVQGSRHFIIEAERLKKEERKRNGEREQLWA
jgi:hypothetical protein